VRHARRGCVDGELALFFVPCDVTAGYLARASGHEWDPTRNTRPWTFAMHWLHRGIIEQAQSRDRRHLGIAGSGEIAEFLPVWAGIVHAVICVPFTGLRFRAEARARVR